MRRLMGVALVLALLGVGGCKRASAENDGCDRIHRLEREPRTDVTLLSKFIQLNTKPISVHWVRGPLGGESSLPGGGDWELIAILEFAEEDQAEMADAAKAEVAEVDLPTAPWISAMLGMPMPPPPHAHDCTEQTLKLNGLGYDGSGFQQYFLKTNTFMKVSGSPYFVLWMSTRPQTPAAAQAGAPTR
ncbi:MAG: hypothetical protein U1E65_18580 [Myxococcota bacterium]